MCGSAGEYSASFGYNEFMREPNAALLLVDMQKESQYGIEGGDDAVAAAASVLTEWRAAGLPVVYTRHVNRADATGLTVGEALDPRGLPVYYRAGTQAIDVVDAIAPQQQDVVVDKHRWSGFYGTPLDLLLRSMEIGPTVCWRVHHGLLRPHDRVRRVCARLPSEPGA